MYGLPLRLAGRVSLLARTPAPVTARSFAALPGPECVRYQHKLAQKPAWMMRGSQAARKTAYRGRQDRKPAPEREDEGPLFEPDPLEADASVAGEHLAGSVEFTTLKPHVSDATYQAITSRPLQLTTMSEVQAQVFALMPNLAAPPPGIEPDADADADADIQAGRKDLLIQAKTGTGKTLAFLVPAIEQRIRTLEAVGRQAAIDAGAPGDKALAKQAARAYARRNVGTVIISPTRELATQIANEALRVSANHPEFEVRLFVGGVSKGMQMRGWERGRRDIVVATTGRLLDLLRERPEMQDSLRNTQLLVLDEADTLLDMGFRDDIEILSKMLPAAPQRQTFLCSATLSREITQVARGLLRPDHTFIRVVSSDDSPVHAHIAQYHTVLPDASHQIQHLIHLIAHDQIANAGRSKVIIFINTTKKTQLFATIMRELAKTSLPASRTNVYELHSKKTQDSRSNTSNMFRYDRTGAAVLVTSDVSARGVDYPGVTRVIQVGTASSAEVYIHRVGRTGRAGSQGRGDLVLLPWEAGFAEHTLKQVPLKPLGVRDLKSELDTLATDFEADPAKFIQRPPVAARAPHGHPRHLSEPATYRPGVPERVGGVPDAVARLRERLDEEAINETFTSMLGFYVGRVGELRMSKQAIVEGCKAWTVEAMGLPAPPYTSQSFLQKLGVFGDERAQPARRDFGGSFRGRPSGNSSFGRPRFDKDRVPYGGDRQSSGRDGQSFGGGDRKSFGRDRPSYGGDRPSYGGDRPSFGGDRPSYGGGRQSSGYGGGRQSFGGDRQSSGGGRPSFNRDRGARSSRWED